MPPLADLSPTPPREDSHASAPATKPAAASPASPSGSRSPLVVAVLVIGAVLAIGIAFSVLSRLKAASDLKKATAEEATLSFNVVHPSAVATAGEITLPGSAQAFMDTAIYARTSGYLKSWKVDIGTRVKQGDLLAEIETPEVDHQLDQARADLKNAEANLQFSQITETRAEDLFKKKTISGQERDQSVSDLAAKRALVDAGQANVRRLEQLKAFENVQAPFDGVITARNTDVGALIQASESTSAKELFHLADTHILRIYFSVPEVYAASITHGNEATITFDSFPREKFTGKLMRDSAAIDPLSHTLNVEADVENTDGRLFPGGYATVHLKIPGTDGSVTIPANTLLFRAEGTSVALVRDGKVVLAPIEIGHDFGNTLEVINGLTVKDEVILDPPDSIAEGDAAKAQEQAPKPK